MCECMNLVLHCIPLDQMNWDVCGQQLKITFYHIDEEMMGVLELLHLGIWNYIRPSMSEFSDL